MGEPSFLFTGDGPTLAFNLANITWIKFTGTDPLQPTGAIVNFAGDKANRVVLRKESAAILHAAVQAHRINLRAPAPKKKRRTYYEET